MKKYVKPLTTSDRLAAWFLVSSIRLEHLYNPENKTGIQKGLELLDKFLGVHFLTHYRYQKLI